MGPAAAAQLQLVSNNGCLLYPGRDGDSHKAGVFFFFGGLLMILGSIGEWIIGNTFPFVVFGTFGESPHSSCDPINLFLHQR